MDKVAEPWARDLISKVGRAIVGGGESAIDVFRQFDKDNSGFLEYVLHQRARSPDTSETLYCADPCMIRF
jgi:hypothetical protein